MKESVLADFYNLHLKLKKQRVPKPLEEALTEEKMLEILARPDEDEQQKIRKFFKTYVPNAVRKLTAERKQQIQELFCYDKFEELEEKIDKAWQNDEQEEGRSLFDYKRNIFVDASTTLEGYETIYGVSWFDDSRFKLFAEEYQHIRWSIKIYLDSDQKNAGRDWLKSRINIYTQNPNKAWQFGIYLGGIFPLIHKEAMSVLKGELQVQRCQQNGCNNIFLKSRRRKYCSECSYKAKLERDREGVRQEAAKVYKTLCNLIDKWLKQDSEGITATELKEELKKIAKESYKPGSIEIPFLGGVTAKSLGRLLPQVEEKLKEKGILIEIKKRKKGYLYRFTRIQS